MSCKLSDKCDNVFACNVLRPEVELLGCSFYKPKKPMTNEEYLRLLNTEQLADLMSRIVGCSNCPIPKDGRNCIGTYRGCWYEIIKWLKQPHHEKE